MALVTLPGHLVYPIPAMGDGAYLSSVVDAVGEKFAVVMHVPKAGRIRKVHFRTGAVTLATDTDVRIESVSATTGDPSGALFAANTNVTVLAAAITANAWVTTGALTADAVVAANDLIAVVIAPGATPNFNLVSFFGTEGDNAYADPYCDHFTASWAKLGRQPVLALEYDDGSFAYQFGCWPISAVTSVAFSSASTPDEYANRLVVPTDMTVVGLRYMIPSLAADADVVLYNSVGGVLATKTLDKDIVTGTASGHHILFDTPVTLARGDVVYLSYKPSASNSTIQYYTFSTAALLGTFSGGTDVYLVSRTDGGAWSPQTAQRLPFSLIISAIDNGTGSGQGTAIPSIATL